MDIEYGKHEGRTRTSGPWIQYIPRNMHTVFALLCFVVVIHWLIFPYPSGLLHWHWGNLTIAPSASKATLMNMDKYFMWIHYERLHNHNKAKHNKTVCIFLGIYCTLSTGPFLWQGSTKPALEFRAWLSNCTHTNWWDVITHWWIKFHGCSVTTQPKLRHGIIIFVENYGYNRTSVSKIIPRILAIFGK